MKVNRKTAIETLENMIRIFEENKGNRMLMKFDIEVLDVAALRFAVDDMKTMEARQDDGR